MRGRKINTKLEVLSFGKAREEIEIDIFKMALWIDDLAEEAADPTEHPSSISLSNVSFCVPILGTKNVTCLSDAPALRGFQRRTLTYSFLRGLAALVIGKVRVLRFEFTGVTLA